MIQERGSSPLTRGKPGSARDFGVVDGLIPAHAGKTRGDDVGLRLWWAHPRSRGENFLRASMVVMRAGSSPLTRGKRPQRDGEAPSGGLIPAHAGKTREGNFAASASGAHPRSRGENRAKENAEKARLGSSPLTRGKLSRFGLV